MQETCLVGILDDLSTGYPQQAKLETKMEDFGLVIHREGESSAKQAKSSMNAGVQSVFDAKLNFLSLVAKVAF